MNRLASCLYRGEVAHRRVSPVAHRLSYRVYNLFVDIDELPELSKRLRLFAYNGFNLFSIVDRKHGPGDGTPIGEAIWRIARASQTRAPVTRIFMFCYPRVLGFVFNPLTVYYCFDRDERLQLMIYEVNNTFGERHSYAIPVSPGMSQHAQKKFHVSPFNQVEGEYRFAVEHPGERLRLGITLKTDGKPCLHASFAGVRKPLSDANLLRSFARLPLLPLQVIGGIHWEAARLWWKGLPFRGKPAPPQSPVTFISDRNGR
jgi:uncharacterized protein